MAACRAQPQVRNRLARIDELCLNDPALGLRLLETEINTQLLQLKCGKAADKTAASALAAALAIWSDQQRLSRRQDLALDACLKALDFAETSGDRWAVAHAFKAAALLAQELGMPGCSLAWLERAGFCFGLEKDLAPVGRILATQGQILADKGDYPSAAAALRDALARLPAADRGTRRSGSSRAGRSGAGHGPAH